MVGKELEGDDVEETLETVDGLWHSDDTVRVPRQTHIGVVGDDDGCTCVGRSSVSANGRDAVEDVPFRAVTCSRADRTLG